MTAVNQKYTVEHSNFGR